MIKNYFHEDKKIENMNQLNMKLRFHHDLTRSRNVDSKATPAVNMKKITRILTRI